jgi:hypothetical protein
VRLVLLTALGGIGRTHFSKMTNLALPREFKSPEIPIVGNQPSIQMWTGKPNVWGSTPQGWPLYRVIWSESRYYLLGGEWGDNGRVEYRWSPYYAGRKEWMLEKWLTPEEYAGSEIRWNEETVNLELAARGFLVYTMGPYPRLGWYEHCFSFPTDGEPNLECIVPLLEASKTLPFAKIKQGLAACHDQMRKEWENRFEAIVDDAQGAFHNAPSNVNPGKVTADRVILGNEQDFRAALAKQKDQKERPITESPKDLELPDHGFSIRQRKT